MGNRTKFPYISMWTKAAFLPKKNDVVLVLKYCVFSERNLDGYLARSTAARSEAFNCYF